MHRLLTVLRRLLDAVLAPFGLLTYRLTGRTPTATYRAMRRVHTVAPGFGDPRRRSDPTIAPVADAALGPLDARDLAELRLRLDRDGYAVLDQRLDAETVAELTRLASEARCRVVGRRGGASREMARFDPERPLATRYELPEETILADPTAQALAVDEGFRRIAATYLRAEPVNDMVSMWWTAPDDDIDLSVAAQMFHADRDRLSFVKFFVYLTDVGPGDGPHVYVRGSHHDRPARLRADRRFTDEEVLAHYDEEDLVSVEGPAGTVFVADTLGLHKGTPPMDGIRLVFQVEYATSLLGAPYERIPSDLLTESTRATVEANPHSFQRLGR
ncbi:MAG: phytanoyl-CoA dioxygenase family protein [Actinomycetota bacterium]